MKYKKSTDVFEWNILIFLIWFPCFIYCFSLKQMFVSIGIYSFIVYFVYFFVTQVIKKYRSNGMFHKNIIFCLLCFVVFFFLVMLHFRDLPKEGLRNTLYLLLFFMMAGMCFVRKLSQAEIKKLYFYPNVLTWCMFCCSFFESSYDPHSGNALCLGFNNPNILAPVITMAAIYQALGLQQTHSIFYLAGIIVDIGLVYLTQARSCLLSVIFLLFFVFIYRKEFKFKKWMIVIVTFIPLIFASLVSSVGKIFKFKLFGKYLESGRRVIWKSVIDEVNSNIKMFWFGRGTYNEEIVWYNSHNLHFQIINYYGVPIFILFIMLLIVLGVNAYRTRINRCSTLCFAGITSIYIFSSFESMMIDQFIGQTFLWIVLYWIILSQTDEKECYVNAKGK